MKRYDTNAERLRAWRETKRLGETIGPVVTGSVSLGETIPPSIEVPPETITPSVAFPRQLGRCIRCGGRIPLSDNFCSDAHYQEHLNWLRSRAEAAPLGRRQELRDRLDEYRVEYMAAACRQDWETCDRVNQEREPLFYELWELENGLKEGQYWIPARVLNQGLQTAKK